MNLLIMSSIRHHVPVVIRGSFKALQSTNQWEFGTSMESYGFPKEKSTPNSWRTILLKWMMTGGTPILGNLHIISCEHSNVT